MRLSLTLRYFSVGISNRPCCILYSLLSQSVFKRFPQGRLASWWCTREFWIGNHWRKSAQLYVVPAPRTWHWGSQTTDAYSRIGRTIVFHWTLAFFEISFEEAHCYVSFGDCVLYMYIPWLKLRVNYGKVRKRYEIDYSIFFFLVEILITTHLVWLKLICQVCSHCPNAERSL